MKKLFGKILIVFAMMVTLGVSAEACVISSDAVKKEIASIVKNKIEKSNSDVEVNVKVLGVPFEKLEVADGVIKFEVNVNENQVALRQVQQVRVYSNGELVKTFGVPLEINVYKDVLVAKTLINRTQTITSVNTEVKRVNISNCLRQVLSKNDLNKELMAKKNFREGEMLTKTFVQSRPDVLKNSIVKIDFKSTNSISITMEGIAMSDGNIGDFINIENKRLKRVYTGKIVGNNKVFVQI